MKRVVCLGSSHGADALAWRLADALQKGATRGEGAEMDIVCCASPAQLTGLCAGTRALAIIDATPDLSPGCVRRVDETELAERPSGSSHGIDLLTALGVARALGDVPSRFVILGVGVAPGSDPAQLVAQCLSAVRSELEAL